MHRWQKGPTAHVARLLIEAAKEPLAQLSRNSRAGYAADWRSFTMWCESAQHQAMPATISTVQAYLAAILAAGCKVSTAIHHATAINNYHRVEGYAPPATRDVHAFLVAIRRMRGERPERKRALEPQHLAAICQEAGTQPAGMRDRALLTFGFASALRRSNIVALDLDDIEIEKRGVKVAVRHEKTDQRGLGRVIGIWRDENEEVCPVRNCERWLDIRGTKPGALFTPVYYNSVVHRRLKPAAVARIVKRAVTRIGLNPEVYSGHSLRAGYVTAALEAGTAESMVMRQTGHTDVNMLRRYLRSADPFRGGKPAGL